MEVLRALKDVEGVEKAEMVYGLYDTVDRVERDSFGRKRINKPDQTNQKGGDNKHNDGCKSIDAKKIA